MKSAAVARVPTAHAVEVDDEAVVVDDATGTLYLLNATGAIVWECLDGESTLEEICADLADELGVPLDVVLRDSEALVRHLHEQRLVVVPGVPWPAGDGDVPEGEHGPGCGCGDHAHDHDGDHRDPRLLADPPNL